MGWCQVRCKVIPLTGWAGGGRGSGTTLAITQQEIGAMLILKEQRAPHEQRPSKRITHFLNSPYTSGKLRSSRETGLAFVLGRWWWWWWWWVITTIQSVYEFSAAIVACVLRKDIQDVMSSRGKRILGLSRLLHLPTPKGHAEGLDKVELVCKAGNLVFGILRQLLSRFRREDNGDSEGH